MPVEFELARIIINEGSSSQVVVLRERGGPRSFPIVIGLVEAMAIDREIKGEHWPRPLTHDLLSSVIRAMGGGLERIVVSDLKDSTFYAVLEIRRNGDLIRVDARPSDAIALAVRSKSPVFVEEVVLEKVTAENEAPGLPLPEEETGEGEEEDEGDEEGGGK